MKKVLITGGDGYLARSFTTKRSHDYDIQAVGRNILDLTDKTKTKEFLKNKYFDIVLHTAIVGGSRLNVDSQDTFYKNILMIENLLQHRGSFGKIINFGSGAEIYHQDTQYGLSKKIINNIIKTQLNAYTLRVFAVFDENELNTRFIKRSIINTLNGEPITIHQNRLFDFFYMDDLIKVIDLYIANDSNTLDKEFDCCYQEKISLLNIAEKIKSIIPYANISIDNPNMGTPYIGIHKNILLNYYGLDQGIHNVINFLKNVENKK